MQFFKIILNHLKLFEIFRHYLTFSYMSKMSNNVKRICENNAPMIFSIKIIWHFLVLLGIFGHYLALFDIFWHYLTFLHIIGHFLTFVQIAIMLHLHDGLNINMVYFRWRMWRWLFGDAEWRNWEILLGRRTGHVPEM